MNKELVKSLEKVSQQVGTKEFKELCKRMGLRISKTPNPAPSLPQLELMKEEWLGYSIEPYKWNAVDMYIRDVYTRNGEYRMVIVDEGMRTHPIGRRTAFSRWDYTGFIELIIKKTAKKRTGTHSVTLHAYGDYVQSPTYNRFYKGLKTTFFHYEFPTSELLTPNGVMTKISTDMEHCVNMVCESHLIYWTKKNSK